MHFIHIGHILKLIGLLFFVLQIGPNDVANFLPLCFGNTTYAIWRDLTRVGHPWRLFCSDDPPAGLECSEGIQGNLRGAFLVIDTR